MNTHSKKTERAHIFHLKTFKLIKLIPAEITTSNKPNIQVMNIAMIMSTRLLQQALSLGQASRMRMKGVLRKLKYHQAERLATNSFVNFFGTDL
jgi:hypothetical protein